MAQDFAKQRSNPDGGKRKQRAVSRAPQPSSAHWSWFFSGLMSGVIVSIAAYLGVLKLEEGVAEDAQAAQVSTNPDDQPTYSFAFYDALSKAEVAVGTPQAADAGQEGTGSSAVTSGAAAPQTGQALASAPDEKPAVYLLQAGSFQNHDGAESRQASILLLNMNANIVEGIVGGRTHYHVQVGPFAGRRNAEDARDILTDNDIDSIPLLLAQ